MSGRQSSAVGLAVELVLNRGYSVLAAADQQKVAVTSVRRGLAKIGIPSNPVGRPRKI